MLGARTRRSVQVELRPSLFVRRSCSCALCSVFDFSYWAFNHDGNEDAYKGGRRNPITAFAEQGHAEFRYPSWHGMDRWESNKDELTFVGFLGETVELRMLPEGLQTPELATLVGSRAAGRAMPGSLVCGSPGEVRLFTADSPLKLWRPR